MHKTIRFLVIAAMLAAPVAQAQNKVSRFPGQTERAPPPTAEERMGRLDQAGRITLLREADLATRKAFADYQQALAKAREDGKARGAESVLAIHASTAPRSAIKAVADDLSDEALAQQDATRATRNSFQKFTSTLDDQLQLAAAAGPETTAAALGIEPEPAPATVDEGAAPATEPLPAAEG
jgi:hypothetical protein